MILLKLYNTRVCIYTNTSKMKFHLSWVLFGYKILKWNSISSHYNILWKDPIRVDFLILELLRLWTSQNQSFTNSIVGSQTWYSFKNGVSCLNSQKQQFHLCIICLLRKITCSESDCNFNYFTYHITTNLAHSWRLYPQNLASCKEKEVSYILMATEEQPSPLLREPRYS